MELKEYLYITAYCVFLIGSSKSFRENGSKASLLIMSSGILLNVYVTVLSRIGVQFLKNDLTGINSVVMFAMILGYFVWFAFLTALLFLKKGNTRVFHLFIAVTEIAWFVDFISFLYGIYRYPL
jgi:uncharacterized membrane protein YozB (DUF420 family)